ncbi:hypothetical protein HYX15_04125 [Candidatus Woesearchaeota archaeon]|nr:hypothetical protein [Candidatus Woesearchaeota archaeon]
MTSLKILNNKEKKKIIELMKNCYGISEIKLDYVFMKNKDDKVYLLSKDFSKIDTDNIRINSIGMYFAKLYPNGIRLSIEGSQLIGPLAKKNVLEVNNDEVKNWVKGYDILTDERFNGYVIMKNNNDYFGSGFYREGKIENMIPKDRRIKK